MFFGSGQVFISTACNLVVKGRVDRALAKRSKGLALKRARRLEMGFGPAVPLGRVENLQFEVAAADVTADRMTITVPQNAE